jgi:hypothetical protein
MLAALFESLSLGGGPLIAFAVVVALWGDGRAPLLPRRMLQCGLEHLFQLGYEIGFLSGA